MAVFKRNGHWHFTKTIDGVRYRGALKTARTKAQADEAFIGVLNEIHEGTYGRPTGSAVFIDFFEKVYLPWSEENKRSKGDKYYLDVFRRFFKRKTFAEISPMLIEKFKSERRRGLTKKKQVRSPASVNRELACLSSVFSMAMRMPYQYIRENPCFEVEKLLEENRRERYLSADEERRLLDACTDERAHLKPIILLAVNTGMRRGEILSLRWGQIDLARSVIHLKRTKSGKQRDVPINRAVMFELVKLRPESSREGAAQFVFPSARTGIAITHCRHSFAKACKLAGLEDLHFHDLRHTAATRMAELGAEPSTIKDILGHADLRMTDRYTHAVESRKRAALERIADYSASPGGEVVSIEGRKKA